MLFYIWHNKYPIHYFYTHYYKIDFWNICSAFVKVKNNMMDIQGTWEKMFSVGELENMIIMKGVCDMCDKNKIIIMAQSDSGYDSDGDFDDIVLCQGCVLKITDVWKTTRYTPGGNAVKTVKIKAKECCRCHEYKNVLEFKVTQWWNSIDICRECVILLFRYETRL